MAVHKLASYSSLGHVQYFMGFGNKSRCLIVSNLAIAIDFPLAFVPINLFIISYLSWKYIELLRITNAGYKCINL